MNIKNEFCIRIAELDIRMLCEYGFAKKLCADFTVDSDKFDITATASASDLEEESRNYIGDAPSPGYCEAICLYRDIAEQLPELCGFVFHGAAMNIDGKGVIFAARSGVGKTTHISLLLEDHPENVSVINGDKPIVRKVDGEWRVYSTPWAGKEGMKTNTSAPLSAIVLLERSKENFIERVSPEDHFDAICRQIYLPRRGEAQLATFDLIEDMAKNTSFYRLGCNISKEAAKTSYEALSKLD